jgi:hypothetical protein
MTVFEFVFALYSLLFGLALAEVFGGFGNTLQERHKLKVGWLTPLLGLFVIIDLTTFWEIAWQLKDVIEQLERLPVLILIPGVLVAGIYYLAARLVFPRSFAEWPDLDVYYFKHKKWVFGGILFCNIIGVIVLTAEGKPFIRLPLGFANDLTYFALLIALLAVRNKRANVVLLLLLLSRYAVFPMLGYLHIGVQSRLF